MFGLDLAFWRSKFVIWCRQLVERVRGGVSSSKGNFEDELERNMRGFAKANLGIDVGDEAFSG